MSFAKALFTLLILYQVIPLLDIASQQTAKLLQAKVNGDARGGRGLGCDGGGGSGMGVSSPGGCSNAEGSEFSYPKQKAANIAQLIAADAADLKVKTELADKAAQCVRFAEATVKRLQKDAKAAKAVVLAATASLENTLATADSAKTSAREAEVLLNLVKALAHQTASEVANNRRLANRAQAQLDEQKKLLEMAEMRVANATRRMADGQADFDNTKEAAIRAARQRATAHRALLRH